MSTLVRPRLPKQSEQFEPRPWWRGGVSRYPTGLLLTMIVLLALALRLWRIAAEPFWYDEAYTWTGHLLGWWESLTFDPWHPPLYPAVMWVWYQLGDSETWARLFSTLVSVAVVPVTYAIGKELRDRRLGLVAAGLIAIYPIQVHYAQEARAYALLTFLVSLVIWAVVHITTRRHPYQRVFEGYVIAMGLTLLTNNIGVIVFGVANLAVGAAILQDRRWALIRPWAVAQAFTILPWLFWMPTFLDQLESSSKAYWYLEVTPFFLWDVIARDLFAGHLPRVSGASALTFIVLAVTVIGLVMRARHRASRTSAWVLGIFAFAGPLVTIAYSLLTSPSLATRQQIWIAVPVSLLLATVLVRGTQSRAPFDRYAFYGLAVALVLILGVGSILLRGLDKEPWDEVSAFVDPQPGDVIVYTAAHTRVAFDYYEDLEPVVKIDGAGEGDAGRLFHWRWQTIKGGDIAEVRAPYPDVDIGEPPTLRVRQAIAEVDAKRVWVLTHDWDSLPEVDGPIKDFLADHGEVIQRREWKANPEATPGVAAMSVTLYELDAGWEPDFTTAGQTVKGKELGQ